jgi:hypothetical protein
MSRPQCPPIDQALLRWLDDIHPERCPNKGTPLEDIWFYAGGRDLIRTLRIEFERQQKRDVRIETQEAGHPPRRSSAPGRTA